MGKKRQSWSTNTPAENDIFANNPFIEGLIAYMESPAAELQGEVDGAIWDLLEDVDIDAKKRLILWPDAQQLDIDQSVERLAKLYPLFPSACIEDSLLGWLEMGYAPLNLSAKQMDQLDKLTERWVNDHIDQALSPQKKKRTRHS